MRLVQGIDKANLQLQTSNMCSYALTTIAITIKRVQSQEQLLTITFSNEHSLCTNNPFFSFNDYASAIF